MSREIESNNKDQQQASIDTQRDYDSHKSHRNSKMPTTNFDSSGYLNSKNFTQNNTQPENSQQEEVYGDEKDSPKKFTNISEKVVGRRIYECRTLCLVKRQGLPKTANTWEKLEDLKANYQGLIDKFEQKYKLQEERKKKILDANKNAQALNKQKVKQLSPAEPKAISYQVTPAVPLPSTKSKIYTKKDIQEMLGRHTLDNKVLYAIKLKGQSEVLHVQKKDLDCAELIKEADRKYQEELLARSQDIGTQSSTGRSKRKRKRNSKYDDDFV